MNDIQHKYIVNELFTMKTIFDTLINDKEYIANLVEISNVIADALKRGNKILWFGNGGSAADAQHLSAELTGRFKEERRSLSSMALNVNVSVLTAIANDYDYSVVFSRQIEGLCNKGDVCVGITTSGKSKNVINGFLKAKENGGITIGFTGLKGMDLSKIVDNILIAPSDDTPHIQEIHIFSGHMICGLVEKSFI